MPITTRVNQIKEYFTDIREPLMMLTYYFVANILPVIIIIGYVWLISKIYEYYNIFPCYFNKTYANDNCNIYYKNNDGITRVVLTIIPLIILGSFLCLCACICDKLYDED